MPEGLRVRQQGDPWVIPANYVALETRALAAVHRATQRLREQNIRFDPMAVAQLSSVQQDFVLQTQDEYVFTTSRADFRDAALRFGRRGGSSTAAMFRAIYEMRSLPSQWGAPHRLNPHWLGKAALAVPPLPVDEFMGTLTGRSMKKPKAYPVREAEPKTRWEILMGEDTI